MNLSDITVVIPVYGPSLGVESIIEAIRDESSDIPILVIDDASPEPFNLDQKYLDDICLSLERRDINGGFGAAVNTALRHIDTELALIVNSDLELGDEFIQNLAADYEAHHPAVFGAKQLNSAGELTSAARYWPSTYHQVIEWLVPLARFRKLGSLQRLVGMDSSAQKRSGVFQVDWVSGALMLLPVKEVLSLGGFDENFFMYCEEVDLQKRLSERGMKIFLDNNVHVIHEGGGSAENTQRRHWLVNARDYYARKHFISPWPLRIGLILATLINLIWNSMRKLRCKDVDPIYVFRFEFGLIRQSITAIKAG